MSTITTIIATRNRPADLQNTLESLARTDQRDHQVTVVVVDNASDYDSSVLLERYQGRIRIIHLSQPEPGKNKAINTALPRGLPADYVHFTDDDVSFPKQLYHLIHEYGESYPEYSVFGSRVHLEWPPVDVPGWAMKLAESGQAFSHMDLGRDVKEYPSRVTPLGTSFWVRGSVFQDVPQFDESIGPGLKRRVMGSETSFLIALEKHGHRFLYCPSVDVGHHVQASLLEPGSIVRRALSSGRGGARLRYLRQGPEMFGTPLLFGAVRVASIVRWGLAYASTWLIPQRDRRVQRRWKPAQALGWNSEALRLVSRRLSP